MSLLSRYILRQIWVPALLASVVISFIVIAGAIQEQVRLLMKQFPVVQFTLGDISRMSLYALPTLAGYIFPVTLLLGIMLTFGRMAQQSELTAMKAAGIPLKRAILPVILTGAAVSGLCFLVQDQGQPWAYARLTQLVTSDLPLRMTIDMLPTGVMHEYGDWRVYIGENDGQGTLHDIVVLQPQPNGQAAAFYADSAGLVKEEGGTKLEMRQGLYILPSAVGENVTQWTFDTLKQPVPALKTPDKASARQGMTLRELYHAQLETAASYAATGALPVALELRKLRIEVSERLSFPLMCLAVTFMAAPIGARTRRAGRSFTFSAGFLIIGVYFVLRKVIEPAFIPSLGTAIALGQIPNLLMCSVGAWLVWRVDNV